MQAEDREAAELRLQPIRSALDAGARAVESFRCSSAYRHVSLDDLFNSSAACS